MSLNRKYDYILDCNTCRQMYAFATPAERAEELERHQHHETDQFLQMRI